MNRLALQIAVANPVKEVDVDEVYSGIEEVIEGQIYRLDGTQVSAAAIELIALLVLLR